MPAPPSLVAEPPIPAITERTPAARAATSSWPKPKVEARRGSRRSSGSNGRPDAAASSTIAMAPPSIRPYAASTTSPSGPSTGTGTRRPECAATSASTVPSPPSATGTSTTSASGQTERMPRAIAAAAAGELSDPLYGLGATTNFRGTNLERRA